MTDNRIEFPGERDTSPLIVSRTNDGAAFRIPGEGEHVFELSELRPQAMLELSEWLMSHALALGARP